MLRFIFNFKTWGILLLSSPFILHYTQKNIQPWVFEYPVMQIVMKIVKFTEEYSYGILTFFIILHIVLFFNDKIKYGGRL